MTTILEGLLAQAEGQGADRVTLRAIAEEAGELGAKRALAMVGLMDAGAESDVAQLRQLIQGWRDAKRSAISGLISWVVRSVVALFIFGLAFQLGLTQQARG
jgi:hypothetical protein